MQITLVQTELEQAIREYVGRQLTVANGTEMVIELSATRGAEGFKAIIDIQPAKSPAAPAGPTPRAIPFAVVPAEAKVTENPPSATTAPAEEATQTAETSSSEEQPTAEAAGSAEAASHSDTESQTQSAAPARSLFKGLAKPKNS